MKKTDDVSFSAEDWYKRGQDLIQGGGHREAVEALDRAIAKDPACADAYFARGACYYKLGRYDRAGDDRRSDHPRQATLVRGTNDTERAVPSGTALFFSAQRVAEVVDDLAGGSSAKDL